MKRYRVTKTITIHGGFLRLNGEQAAARSYGLKKTRGKDRYEVIFPVQFKTGEEIGLDGDIDKALLGSVEVIGEAAE